MKILWSMFILDLRTIAVGDIRERIGLCGRARNVRE